MVAQVAAAEEDIDLRAVAAILWARRSWLVLSVILFAIPFVAAAYLMTPVYRATIVLADARETSSSANSLNSALNQLGGLAALARIGPSSTSQVDEALAVMS